MRRGLQATLNISERAIVGVKRKSVFQGGDPGRPLINTACPEAQALMFRGSLTAQDANSEVVFVPRLILLTSCGPEVSGWKKERRADNSQQGNETQ